MCLAVFCLTIQAGQVNDATAVKIIVTESAGEPYLVQVAVGNVIRIRGSAQGFYGLTHSSMLNKQPRSAFVKAARAWEESKTNIVVCADHFENIKAFGTPKWARGVKPVATLGDLTFYNLKYATSKKTAPVASH